MQTIPFKKALQLLDRALDIHVPGYDSTESFSLDTAEGANTFLEITCYDGDNEFFFRFKESDNQEVKVDGDLMTLTYADAVVDDRPSEIEIKLMRFMQLEPKLDAVHEQQCKLESSLNLIQAHCNESGRATPGDLPGRIAEIRRHTRDAKQAFDWLDNFTALRACDGGGPCRPMKLIVSTGKSLDQEAAATVLEEVGRFLRNSDTEYAELMDGSIRIDTTHGAAFFEHEPEDDDS